MPQLITAKTSFDLMMITSFLLLLAGFMIALPAASGQMDDCTYTIYVQTGNIVDAGTHAVVTLAISDQAPTESGLIIPNLEQWGQMGAGYDYFERGHLDIFSGRSRCLSRPPCWMILSHDNTGNGPGWYVDFVLVIVTSRDGCRQHVFRVDQWLARDGAPFQTATTRNSCGRRSSSSLDGNIVSIIPTPLTTTLQLLVAEATSTDHDDVAVAARQMGSGKQQNMPPAL